MTIQRFILGTFFIFPALIPSFSAHAQVSLRMVGPEDIGGAWKEVIRRFHEKHSGIRIDYVSGPWSTDERENMYARSFLGGDPFELVYMDVIWTGKFAKKGWLFPLDEWFPPEKREAFFPSDIEAVLYEDHLYRIPIRTDAGMLYYRKDLIPDPPRTWEEFEGICEKTSNPPA